MRDYFGLKGRGQAAYDQGVRDEYVERREFYRQNPGETKHNLLAAHEARMGPRPGELGPDPAGMRAWFGLLGRNINMKGGFNPKAQDLNTGRTYDMNPKSLGYELPPGLRGAPDEEYALATGQNPGGKGWFTPDELRQAGLRSEGLEDTGRRLAEDNMARQAMMGLKRFRR